MIERGILPKLSVEKIEELGLTKTDKEEKRNRFQNTESSFKLDWQTHSSNVGGGGGGGPRGVSRWQNQNGGGGDSHSRVGPQKPV